MRTPSSRLPEIDNAHYRRRNIAPASPQLATHLKHDKRFTNIYTHIYHICFNFFAGFIFSGLSIFVDFAFFNSWMPAIVLCVSIDV